MLNDIACSSRQRGQDAAPRQCEEVKQKQVFRQQQEFKQDAFTLDEWTKQRNFREGRQRSAVSQREGQRESLGKGTKQKPVVFERSQVLEHNIEQTIEQTTASQPVGWILTSKRRGVFEQKCASSQQVEIKPESEQNRRFELIRSGEKEQNSNWSQHAPGQSQGAKTKCASMHHQELEEEPTPRSSRQFAHRQHGEAELIAPSKHRERVAGKSATSLSQRLEQNHFSGGLAISSQNQSPSRQSEMIAKFEQKPSSRRSGTKEPAFSQDQGLEQNTTFRRSEGAARSSPSSKSQDFEHKPRNRQSEEVLGKLVGLDRVI